MGWKPMIIEVEQLTLTEEGMETASKKIDSAEKDEKVELSLTKKNRSFRRSKNKAGAVKKLAKVFSFLCSFVLILGLITSKEKAFFQKLGVFSVGFLRPGEGAVVLSEWLEREPAAFQNEREGHSLKQTELAAGEGQSVDKPPVPKIIPPEAGDGGEVSEEQLTSGNNFVEGVAVKDNSGEEIDISEYFFNPDIKMEKSDKPQVLIVHTHTTEAYMEYYAGYFNADDKARSLDNTKNVVRVGEAIADQLKAQGIGVIHDVSVHDNPQYTGAYGRAEQTIQKQLDANPSIKVVLDIHRDAINQSATHKIKPTAVIRGKKAAQIMLVTGVYHSDNVPHPNWKENLALSVMLQQKMHGAYPGIIRPLYLVDSRYNQHMTNGSLLIEMGSEANTLEEAEYSGQLLGKTLGEVLNGLTS